MAVYDVIADVVQEADGTLHWAAHVLQDGAVETGATDCTATMYEKDGTATGDAETDSTPDARGVFQGSMTPDLTAGKLYYLHFSITADASPRTGILYFKIPVRTD